MRKVDGRKKFRSAFKQVIGKLCMFGKLKISYKVFDKVLRVASMLDTYTCQILMESNMKKGISSVI